MRFIDILPGTRLIRYLAVALSTLAASCPPAMLRAQSAPTPSPLDINDVSFLFPVPTEAAQLDSLISVEDAAADGKIFPDALLGKLMDEAKTVNVGAARISFPSGLEEQFKKPITWKVAGIRVNPSALGSNPRALAAGGIIPSVRLIVQPVTVDGGKVKVHDFAAHVVFVQASRPDPMKVFSVPDNDAFGLVVEDLRAIKAFLKEAGVTTAGKELNVHPGFRFNRGPDEVPGFTQKLRALLQRHLSTKNRAVVSFMGIPGEFEPWIFFKVNVAGENLSRVPISGNFKPSKPFSQMLSFVGDKRVDPAPEMAAAASQDGFGISTSVLFADDAARRLDDELFPGSAGSVPPKLKRRHVADAIANPQMLNTSTTDCVSCHTETTRRSELRLSASEGVAFKHPPGISGVAKEVLPKNKWNVRDFGWGHDFVAGKATPRPTITQRAANEAAESVDIINKGPASLTVPQPVAGLDFHSSQCAGGSW